MTHVTGVQKFHGGQNPAAPAVKREAEEDWGRDQWRQTRGMAGLVTCTRCQDTYWVCEAQDDRPWDGEHECGCGAPGMPCPSCNVSNPDNPPRLPAGFQRDESLDE
jgi:hypothetical protein